MPHHINTYILNIYGGAHSVMVIVGNVSGEPSSNPGQER